ncbi:sulfur carrier protein ThiS [Echinicola vietnamensis]|uniref:Thiamine biosynthesis protein ThiS n=1 Tax=Echinicola vietnamensis (strain DSM 17526 / LMG 23754 / KMM 6221) TaxID=926556 RepID=L0G0Q8_ECHVK|nr:sulfur carrier protein ThiS [Echinicola vietnamensis]AGA79784.1 thiamine biosynthesis protein ThiS [Echinicola vietnamensis DSM 17526]
MNFILNGEPFELTEGNLSLSGMLQQQQIDATRGMALAVNDQVIPKSEWDHYQVSENDKILIIKATQGG